MLEADNEVMETKQHTSMAELREAMGPGYQTALTTEAVLSRNRTAESARPARAPGRLLRGFVAALLATRAQKLAPKPVAATQPTPCLAPPC